MEVAIQADQVLLRDSKDGDSPVLAYDRNEWRVFVEGVKSGEFDLP